jgi:outer membrane protein assembly factor BamB
VAGSPTQVGNHLYLVISSLCDLGPYHGRIVDINTATHAIAHTWYVSGSATGPQGGGIWGWGGVSVDPADGDVYAATGNVFAAPENSFYGDSVVRLSSSLQVQASHAPGVTIVDDDFGSTPTLFQKPGCPKQFVALQKNGSLYLYDRDSIASGYRQRIDFSQPSLIGVATYSFGTHYVYVDNPKGSLDGTYKRGIAAFAFDGNCKLTLAWQTPATVSVGATPTVANGVVYYAGGFGGTVRALNAATGVELWNSGTSITGPVLAEPVVFKGHLYAAGYDNSLHSWGL